MIKQDSETNHVREEVAGQAAAIEPRPAPTLRDLVDFLKRTKRPDKQFGIDLETIQAEQERPGDDW